MNTSDIIQQAKLILHERLKNTNQVFDDVHLVKDFAILQLAEEKSEQFCVMFLNTKNRLIKFEVVFQGTINQSIVYPRELVRRCIAYNAAAIILFHNHPSGDVTPSQHDEVITTKLQTVLTLIDVSIHDHIIVANTDTFSFAEHGLLV